VATRGTSPNQELILTWEDAKLFYSATSRLSFSIILSQGSPDVDVVYGSIEGDGSATIGMQNQDGTKGTEWRNGCGTSINGADLSNTAIRFKGIR
jgi:hypothetical protein